MDPKTTILYPAINSYLQSLDTSSLQDDRLAALQPLQNYLKETLSGSPSVELTFICTHNSRRSHLGQVWMQVLAAQAGLPIKTYSGGTEATACNPRTVTALREAGFEIPQPTEAENPHYHIQYSDGQPAIEAWSKVYTDQANPKQGFGAIMTCDSANEACPVVFGASARFPILYRDPKEFDNTPQEKQAYAERCKQIATEMKWVIEGLG